MTLNNLHEAILYFENPQNCIDQMVKLRWPEGVTCPTCGSTEVTYMPTRRLFQCKAKHPRKQFSVKVGTVMEDSPIPLNKWLLVGWMLAGCRNGISSHEVARTIGITQKSAWFMLHRLRLAMQIENPEKIGGAWTEVEVDETFIGGKSKFMHKRKRLETGITNRGSKKGKTIVQGMLERGGEVRVEIVESRTDKLLQGGITKNVEELSCVITDELNAYKGLPKEFFHEAVNHLEGYVVGRVHTNSLENFWSCLKRTLKGTYVAVAPKHLMAYLSEQTFRFNVRKGYSEQQRFSMTIAGVNRKRITYAELISKA